MSDVRVGCQAAGEGWSCRVSVGAGSSATEHEVTVSRAELRRFAGETSVGGDPSRLVEASFEYLLERESKESILRSFALSEIERYFPDYPEEIRGRL